MLQIFLLLSLVAVNAVKIFNRTGHFIDGNIVANETPHGLTVIQEETTSAEFLWTEEVNANNPLKVFFGHFFEHTGKREIVNIENICHNYNNDALKRSVQGLVLSQFGNSEKCPIKTGTKGSFSLPYDVDFQTKSKDCGAVHGTLIVYKKYPKKKKNNLKFLFLLNYRGNVTGSDC